MKLHSFPLNSPGNFVVLRNIKLLLRKFTMEFISLLVALLLWDQITININNNKLYFTLLKLLCDIPSCLHDVYILIHIIHIYLIHTLLFSLPSRRKNVVQIAIKCPGKILFFFTFTFPAMNYPPLRKYIPQWAKTFMEDVTFIIWSLHIQIILLRHNVWWKLTCVLSVRTVNILHH